MTTPKNMRHGRIKIESGDTVPLVKYAEWTDGNFSTTGTQDVKVQRDRGKIRALTRGDEQPVGWTFSARYVDKTLWRCVRDKVWDGQTEALTGLTGGANNAAVALIYDYEQNSLAFATGETGTKLAIAAVPATDDEFSEALGADDVEGVTKVDKALGFNVFQPAADTDRDIVYDAVGDSTLAPTGADCSGSVKTVKLTLEISDPCDPFDPEDSTVGTIVEKLVLDHSYVESDGFGEGDEADVLTLSGSSLAPKGKVAFVTV